MRIASIVRLLLLPFAFLSGQDQLPRLTASLPSPFVSAAGGRVYLHLAIAAPHRRHTLRPPVNLCVVLDRSGSMGSERKIENAREAVLTLLRRLDASDRFALVAYDDVVEVVHESTPVAETRHLRQKIESIMPRGSTNLGGGLQEGIRQAEHAFRTGCINRVILLSDGLANQGITDPAALDRIAARARADGISITTMGVGLEYNENLMSGLSESGGGNYYFIEHAAGLTSIVEREFRLLASVCARNVEIDLRLPAGGRVIDVIGCGWESTPERTTIHAGDMYSNEERDVVVEVDLPSMNGTRQIADARLRSADAGGSSAPVAVEAIFTADRKQLSRRGNDSVQAIVDKALANRSVDRATEAMDAGRIETARKELGHAKALLLAAPAYQSSGSAGAMIRNQADAISRYESMLQDSSGNRARAKKQIQYENLLQKKNR